ncbi:hypothetical protein HY992_00235 [Candidatus Micrarchaeota archaeon]|nr:hypothetical protein [Candidatus Micrarchaeota archaeon]
MFEQIAYYTIFGKTMVFNTGVLALSGLIATALLGFLRKKNPALIKWHMRVAKITLLIAITHATLALSAYV